MNSNTNPSKYKQICVHGSLRSRINVVCVIFSDVIKRFMCGFCKSFDTNLARKISCRAMSAVSRVNCYLREHKCTNNVRNIANTFLQNVFNICLSIEHSHDSDSYLLDPNTL